MIEKVSDEAFQSLWIEIQLPQKSNISCGIIYRQHNSPKRFQEYFDDKLEKLITSNKSIYIMGDFNINLLHAETSCYAQDFLLSLQSFSFIPTIDKPTRVYNNSASLIDNILKNKVDVEITRGNIISDISDHYSQFCPAFLTILFRGQNPESKNAETFLVIPGASSTLNSLTLW